MAHCKGMEYTIKQCLCTLMLKVMQFDHNVNIISQFIEISDSKLQLEVVLDVIYKIMFINPSDGLKTYVISKFQKLFTQYAMLNVFSEFYLINQFVTKCIDVSDIDPQQLMPQLLDQILLSY